MTKKITVTTGTRADYGILRPVLRNIVNSKKLELYLIVAGMHFSKKHGMTINQIKKDGFTISAKVKMFPKHGSSFDMAQNLGKGIVQFSKIFNEIKPDINLILGDRDEAFASALSASHMNIINAHIAGGDKSSGIDEYNRHAITKISNIHFAVTNESRKRIIKMGENPNYVFVKGSPAIDEIIELKFSSKKNLESKLGINLSNKEILLVFHPVTNDIQESSKQISRILKAIFRLKLNTIAIAPNSDAGYKPIFEKIENFSKKHIFLNLIPNLPRNDYLGLLKTCSVLVGNTSSGIVEASYFNTPFINIGIRQKNRESDKNVINISGNSTIEIYDSIKKAIKLKRKKSITKKFGDGTSSKKIVKILEKNYPRNFIHKQICY